MWADLRAAFAFLTILPLNYPQGRKPGWSFSGFPLVGLVIGLALAGVAQISPLPSMMTAFAILLVWVVLTGGLHLDGFGDSCDGLLATVEPERRLEILKDPRAGNWAVVGLILLLLGKWVALPMISPLMLVLPPVIGRWAMSLVAFYFPYARSTGMGGYFRDGLGWRQIAMATMLTAVVPIFLRFDTRDLAIAVSTGLLVAASVGFWAAKRLGGGLAGDVYGAICELTELACLWGLSLWASG